MPRAVIFDVDDTLFDHCGSARGALAEVHRRHAPATDFDAFERYHTKFLDQLHPEVLAGRMALDDARRERFRRVFAAVGIHLSGPESDAVAAAYRAGYVPSWRAIDGAAELVAAVRPHARIGVISNNLLEETRDKLIFCGLAPLVDALVVSGDEGIAKPDPRIFRTALDRLGVSEADAVMFGDSWSADIVGAAGAGIRAVWFNPLRKPRPAVPAGVVEVYSLAPAADLLPLLLGPPSPADAGFGGTSSERTPS
jgi:putative hydrolase of the HAD superfamily